MSNQSVPLGNLKLILNCKININFNFHESFFLDVKLIFLLWSVTKLLLLLKKKSHYFNAADSEQVTEIRIIIKINNLRLLLNEVSIASSVK